MAQSIASGNCPVREGRQMAMTTAERRGYQQICGDGRAMMVIAADQRGGMREVLATTPEARRAISDRALGEVKVALAQHLGRHAGCILVDPLCAVPWMVDDGLLPRETAMLIGLDASGYDETPQGFRQSRLVPGVDARAVRRMGATGGKIMVYLRPDQPDADAHNIAILRQVIADFAAEDIILVTEFLTYPLPGESPDSYKAALPGLITAGSRICLDLGANLLKIPFPGTAAACAQVTELCGDVPWAVLSAGVDHATFLSQVETAMANGASGVIAGRSLWKDCIHLDSAEMAHRLTTRAVPRLRELQAVIARHMG
jgi:tagatose-1,6-bisphosphate aldolase